MILTEEIHLFRETARHLWNSYLKQDADFDTVDIFKDICFKLFEEKILYRLNLDCEPIPIDANDPVINMDFRIFMEGTGKLPLHVNRDIPPSGYWDYPIEWIPPEGNYDIRPISIMDYNCFGWKNLEFYRVRILNCESHPDLNNRDALIRCDHVDIEFIGKNAEQNGAL